MRALLSLLLTAAPAAAEVPAVVTDILPVQSLVASVMGDLGTPVHLVTGGDAHSVQLRPSEARTLSKADILVWIGAELTPWLDDARGALAPNAVSLALLDAPGTAERAPMFGDAGDEHGDHDHGHHHDHDPHAWLDPQNAMAWAPLIAGALAEADPDNAATYRANADALVAGLETLTSDMAGLLDPGDLSPMIVQHDAYAHLAARFDLPIVASVADSEAAAPGGASVSALADLVASGGAGCVVTEAGGNDSIARRLAGSDIPVVEIDPLGLRQMPGPDGYAETLRALAAELARCG
ncbi:metal ABC transporter solute-binding protein, Zn/Mn family [Anianabacter salinae]|uniref:metal ABC transporter solute-binding protein, Zn/Mn family n=1 Tax=Anianabacter salinae TaxID=2851023 RepID=UPI00225E31B6|nr:zinc ABC transporter substrate-binding protein [Anianabacter salinae]MBV0910880.1 zinc ABC transporter substrate-binding protein [Anianabacter salinae]